MDEFKLLDSAKFSSFHRKLVFTTGVGAFTDLYNTIIYSAAVYSILFYYHTTLTFYGIVGALFFVGGVFGALTWGIIADRIGRRASFILDLTLMAIFAILSGIIATPLALAIFRFIIGFALGGDYPSALAMLSEFSPVKIRGRLLVTFWTLFAAGGFTAGIVGYITLVHFGVSGLQMRIILATGAIPAIVGVFTRLWIPESPRWLVKKKRLKQAAEALSKATGLEISNDYFTQIEKSKPKVVDSLRLFFNRRNAYITAALAIVVLLPNFIPTAAASFSPYLFSLEGISKINSVLYLSFLFELPLMIFGLLTAYLVEKWGRLKTMSTNAIIIGIAAIVMSYLLTNRLGLIIAFIIAAGTSIMYFGIAYSLAAELYPTQIRGAAEGYNTSLSRLSGALAYLLTPLLVTMYGESGLWKIYGSLAIIGILISFVMLRKYMNVEDKTLEEISEPVKETEPRGEM